MNNKRNPIEDLAHLRHEFGEHGGVNMSIEASTTFTVIDPKTMPDLFEGRKGPDKGCYLYGRHFNPTVFNLGRQMAALAGTEAGYCTASGMAAISGAILGLCNAGDEVVASNAIYGGSYALLHDFLPAKAGITTTFVDITDLEAVTSAITARTKLVFTESISNPTLRLANMPRLAAIAHEQDIPLVVDNTFSPLLLRPAALGADIVVHSITKFISGASDVIAGAICGSENFVGQLMDLHMGPLMLLGPTMDPHVAASVSLRIPHLPLRMAAHGERALQLSRRLDALGLNVCYPGLPLHPDHELFNELRSSEYGYGGVLTLDVGDEETANRLMSYLQNEQRFGYLAVSLGYFDTLMSCSGSSTSSELSDDDKAAAGISPGLVRMAVGYTGTLEQRWGQLLAALEHAGIVKAKQVRARA
ncbi:MAG: aminotransferase class I/II-fold pyridoxal phosphate-dependent enzyme [Gammaproteobacteria bacterium]|nr:aminotransferase class I/II-fold pyridoxal phosphate-dependent enzyme [Gammaproteobacteria bacterium]MBT8111700.1 aminotransferase class I/II-fold pyridoxal phosphate-dependent enzyme [Gammaproteobacteria bacterium]NND46846.1 aminotransferase class I/II-fold pyridoxal phosphate-dependent enzyme [Woeseiaceae bacterium]NNL46398.1 aminotransferase class I/II-fold pyridoxal phosphate-dependent enzyme [Woeseiaceae bacterium]